MAPSELTPFRMLSSQKLCTQPIKRIILKTPKAVNKKRELMVAERKN